MRNKNLVILHRVTCTYCHVSAVFLGYLAISVFDQSSSFHVVSLQNCVDITHRHFVCVLPCLLTLTLFRICMYKVVQI